MIEVPKGSGKQDLIRISEHRNVDISQMDWTEASAETDSDPALRVLIDRNRWLALAPAFWEEANRRLRANGLPICKFVKNPSKPVPVHPSLGKELCVLCWAVEDAQPDLIPNALLNWEALAPEERWWLYTMAVATTGQALTSPRPWLGGGHFGRPLQIIHSLRAKGRHRRHDELCWGILR
ncbi:MAG UNVERIFIED_CONTAM: DUF3780 domain-containing protein [Planctomycetaceae bacterium]